MAMFFAVSFAAAQSIARLSTVSTKHPALVSDNAAEQMGFKVKFSSSSQLTPTARNAATSTAATSLQVVSVPHWEGAFKFNGTFFHFTMAGHSPSGNVTTSIATSLIPISFFFDEFVDSNGNNIVIDVSPAVTSTLTGPDFANASYGTGTTQFADAIQRAEFFHQQAGSWHTRILNPRMLQGVVVEVPPGASKLFQTSSGVIFAEMDEGFFVSQLNTILQLEPIKPIELSIALTRNVLLYQNQNVNDCCVLGFHTAFESAQTSTTADVQTFAWASWLSPGIFQNPDIADVLPISHEISEWMNDPFISNATPPWEFPDNSGCQANLETGDPVEVLPSPAFEVTLHSYTYHPQTEALLQWFSRVSPSNAFDNAYSYPDTTALTTHSQPCH